MDRPSAQTVVARAAGAIAFGVGLSGAASCSLLVDFRDFSGAAIDGSASDGHGAGDAPVDADAADADTGSGPSTDRMPTKDVYVRDGTGANMNYASDAFLWVKQSTGFSRHTWISFDISGYTTITAAKLRLYLDMLESSGTGPVLVVVYYAPTASDGWDPSTLTWNGQPAPGTVATMLNVDATSVGTWVEWDVTASVRSDTDGVATFVLEGDPSTSRGAIFPSSRSGAHAPVLRITGS